MITRNPVQIIEFKPTYARLQPAGPKTPQDQPQPTHPTQKASSDQHSQPQGQNAQPQHTIDLALEAKKAPDRPGAFEVCLLVTCDR